MVSTNNFVLRVSEFPLIIQVTQSFLLPGIEFPQINLEFLRFDNVFIWVKVFMFMIKENTLTLTKEIFIWVLYLDMDHTGKS